MHTQKILITGASGQLGVVLTKALQSKFGIENVKATDINCNNNSLGLVDYLDTTNFQALYEIVSNFKVTQIYHMVAILSAKGEDRPLHTWALNMTTFFNVLEVSRLLPVSKVFFPSSIAVYGSNAHRLKVPQSFPLYPQTVYGITKVAGENWANYYHKKYNLDIRSIRYPGVIGFQSMPGGGTTDYVIDLFHKVINHQSFECFLNANTMLPMIYIDDAIRAAIELMEAPIENISVRNSYNAGAMSFTPGQLVESVLRIYPDFKVSYKPDFRQEIANSWPLSIDDSLAQKDWGWKAEYDFDKMIHTMITNIKR